jgi:hypothetical protein
MFHDKYNIASNKKINQQFIHIHEIFCNHKVVYKVHQMPA